MNQVQLDELLYQALETELGGVRIYQGAVACAVNDDLREEWKKYLAETERHVVLVHEIFEEIGLSRDVETPGRAIVRHLGEAMVLAMEKARAAGIPRNAELVAAECVVLAETKDHANWELLGHTLAEAPDNYAAAIRPRWEEVEGQEDEHLYHTRGWARELWFQSLGLPAQLPPPEEQQDISTMKEAAEIEEQRKSA